MGCVCSALLFKLVYILPDVLAADLPGNRTSFFTPPDGFGISPAFPLRPMWNQPFWLPDRSRKQEQQSNTCKQNVSSSLRLRCRHFDSDLQGFEFISRCTSVMHLCHAHDQCHSRFRKRFP